MMHCLHVVISLESVLHIYQHMINNPETLSSDVNYHAACCISNIGIDGGCKIVRLISDIVIYHVDMLLCRDRIETRKSMLWQNIGASV